MKPAPNRNLQSLPPLGVDRAQAAAYIGVDVELFDRLVAERRMPEPRTIHGRLMWDAEELGNAFRQLPRRAPRGDSAQANEATKSEQATSGYANAYTPRTLAERWGCSPQHVRNMIERGELPAFKAGGKLLRIRGDVVEAFECQGDGQEGMPESQAADSEQPTPKRPPAKPLLSPRELRNLLGQR